MGRLLQVARSSDCAWLRRPLRAPPEAEPHVHNKVQPYFAHGRGPYGTRRINPLGAQEGLQGSRRRIGRILAQAGLRGNTRRTCTAPPAAGQAPTVAPHQRNQACTVQAPDPSSDGAMPYLPTGAGWLSLAVGRALGSRAVVGWSLAHHRRAALVKQAWSRALCPRHPAAGLSLPTDRGSQEGAESSRPRLARHGRQPRMSRKGHGGDHAVAESFLHTFKTALGYMADFHTHEQAQTAVCEYIEGFYTRQRCPLANGYLAPLAYEPARKTNEILCPARC